MNYQDLKNKESASRGKYKVYDILCAGNCGLTLGHVGKRLGLDTPFDPNGRDKMFCHSCGKDKTKNPPKGAAKKSLLVNLEELDKKVAEINTLKQEILQMIALEKSQNGDDAK